jgi:hypothetical protein
VPSCSENGNEPLGFLKDKEFPDLLCNCKVVKEVLRKNEFFIRYT